MKHVRNIDLINMPHYAEREGRIEIFKCGDNIFTDLPIPVPNLIWKMEPISPINLWLYEEYYSTSVQSAKNDRIS